MNVPSELEGIAYIQVLIQKESAQLVTANLSHMGAFPGSEAPDQHWQRKLEAAQNVLFCKELFSQLAKEAISLQESFLVDSFSIRNQFLNRDGRKSGP